MRRLLIGAVALFAAATLYLFVWPDEDPAPARADAVVVLAGGRTHRLKEGLRLVERERVAPVLVISDPRGWPEAQALCRRERPSVLCFTPEPYSTQGEARWMSREAGRRGWDSIVVVTSTYHVRRSRMIFERCFDGRLAVVGAEPPAENFLVGVVWEWPKSLYYLAWKRRC